MSKADSEVLIAVIDAKLEMYSKIVEELKLMIEREHQAHREIYETIKALDNKTVNDLINVNSVINRAIGIAIGSSFFVTLIISIVALFIKR